MVISLKKLSIPLCSLDLEDDKVVTGKQQGHWEGVGMEAIPQHSSSAESQWL